MLWIYMFPYIVFFPLCANFFLIILKIINKNFFVPGIGYSLMQPPYIVVWNTNAGKRHLDVIVL